MAYSRRDALRLHRHPAPPDLLDEIKKGTKLRHVQTKEPNSFMKTLQYTLDVLIVNERIKTSGRDDGFLYTDKEYAHAFKKLLTYETKNRFRSTTKAGFGLFIVSTIGLIINNMIGSANSFWTGVYLTNMFLTGSFIFNSM